MFFNNFFQSIVALFKVIVLSKKVDFNKITKQHNKLIILGNGPSLNAMLNDYGQYLNNADVMCVNHFPKTEHFQTIKPKYLIASAPDLWLDNIDEKFVKGSKELFSYMNKKTTWPLYFFFPFEAMKHKRWYEQIKENENIQVINYNNIGIDGFSFVRKILFNTKRAMPRPHNIIVPALMMAIFLRYKEVSLWGTDHSQIKEISVDMNNNALLNQKHFYDLYTSKPETLDKRGMGSRKVHEILFKFMTAFRSYFSINEYAIYKNVKIYNETKNSLIDAFDRKVPETFLKD